VSGLMPVRLAFATLIIGASLTLNPTTAAGHAQHYEVASCARQCEPERNYDRCMSRCLDRQRRSRPRIAHSYLPEDYYPPQRWRPSRGWRLYERLFEALVRFPPEVVTGLLGGGALVIRAINSARRRRDLRVSEELSLRANALEREAADLRAEAFRRRHDI
jgi:hypothetical protein